jgi:hypothetical protein
MREHRGLLSLEDACDKPGRWRRHYNEERPHSAIGNTPPIMLANPTGDTSPPVPGKAKNSRPEQSKVGLRCNNRQTIIPAGRKLGARQVHKSSTNPRRTALIEKPCRTGPV